MEEYSTKKHLSELNLWSKEKTWQDIITEEWMINHWTYENYFVVLEEQSIGIKDEDIEDHQLIK